ncbi:MAG: hemolysin family protein [Phototrophicaceae bacterium]
MDEGSTYLSIIVSLLVLDALMTLGYSALQNSRQSELQEQADAGRGVAKTALQLLESKSQLYITYTLISALVIAGIVLSATMWLVVPSISGDIEMNTPLAVGAVLLISLLALIIGTVVPEAVGSAYSAPFISLLATPLRFLTLLFSPLSSLLIGISTLLARLFGSDSLVNTVTEEEIMTLVNAGNTGGTIEDEEREMIFSVMQLDETLAREIMVPRIDVESIDVTTNLDDALDTFMRTGYSRIPVYEDNIDNIVGVLYAKDLLNLSYNTGLEGHSARELVRSAYFIPEARPADDLLRDMQTRNVHMAIVVDEYGGTSGLVTIENIMEEIVGDIRDEYDLNEETEYIQHNEDEYLIDAGMDVDDVNELLGTSINSEDNDTLGGYIFLQIGRVPIVGEEIDTDEVYMTIRSIEGRRIRKVLVKVKPKPTDEDNDSDNDDETRMTGDT